MALLSAMPHSGSKPPLENSRVLQKTQEYFDRAISKILSHLSHQNLLSFSYAHFHLIDYMQANISANM